MSEHGAAEETRREARRILENRRHEIRDGLLDGRPWFTTIVLEASAVVRRQKAWAERTAA